MDLTVKLVAGMAIGAQFHTYKSAAIKRKRAHCKILSGSNEYLHERHFRDFPSPIRLGMLKRR